MSILKNLLGDAYKDEMTLEEVDKALAGMELVDKSKLPKSVAKERFDQVASELSAANKKLKDLEERSLSDDEKLQKTLSEKDDLIKTLKNEVLKTSAKERLAKAGVTKNDFVDGLIEHGNFTDKSVLDKIMDSFIKVMDETKSLAVQDALAKQIDDTPIPPGGEVDNGIKISDLTVTERMKMKATEPERYAALFEK